MIRTVLATGLLVAASTAPMHLQSNDFAAGATIPKTFMAVRCGGTNRSPALAWSEVPPKTASLALIMHDPDAPRPGGFYHWVVYNIPPSTRSLANDVQLAAGQSGVASTERPGYTGPCPPPGPAHHYHFTLYALDVAHITAAEPLDGPQLEQRIAGHVLASAQFVALAAMP